MTRPTVPPATVPDARCPACKEVVTPPFGCDRCLWQRLSEPPVRPTTKQEALS